jgi:anti-sigma factor RsiW
MAAGGEAPGGLEAHLAVCPGCRAELAALRRALAIADQALAHLATVEPSTSFVPRIRASIAVREAPSRRAAWLWPSLATAAALVLVFILVVSRRTEPQVAVTQMPSTRPAAEAPVQAPMSNPAIVPPQRGAARSRLIEPPVLIPPREARALEQLIALVNREGRAPASLRAPDSAPAQLAALPNIEIQPIEIVPLDPVTSSGT